MLDLCNYTITQFCFRMAKSIRSKSKRKMRAIKREKNAPKELARLIKTLAYGKKDLVESENVMGK